MKLLLKFGARIDDVDAIKQSACHLAAACNFASIAAVLLAHRPNLSLKDKNGDTAANRSIRNRFGSRDIDAVAAMLIRAGAPLDDYDRHELARMASWGTREILDIGIDFKWLWDIRRQTPFHIAIRSRADLSVLSRLIDCGVDLEARSKESQNCLGIAVSRFRVDAVRLLLLAGADVIDGEHEEPQYLLHVSATFAYDTCTLLLLAAGVDVAARCPNGETALLVAAKRQTERPLASWMENMSAMIAAGADLDAAADDGQTPRQVLAECGRTVDPEQVETARREIAALRFDLVRKRATAVCIGLQSLRLNALQLCEILLHACGPVARVVPFHQWWNIATTVKHFKSR